MNKRSTKSKLTVDSRELRWWWNTLIVSFPDLASWKSAHAVIGLGKEIASYIMARAKMNERLCQAYNSWFSKWIFWPGQHCELMTTVDGVMPMKDCKYKIVSVRSTSKLLGTYYSIYLRYIRTMKHSEFEYQEINWASISICSFRWLHAVTPWPLRTSFINETIKRAFFHTRKVTFDCLRKRL